MTDWIYDPDNLILHNLATGAFIRIKFHHSRINRRHNLTRSFNLIKYIHDSLGGDYTKGPDKKYIRQGTIPPKDVITFTFELTHYFYFRYDSNYDHTVNYNSIEYNRQITLVKTNDEKIAIGLLDVLAKSTGAFEMKGCLEN